MQLAGQSALVTGGASGIGQALAAELARRGCRVAVADIDGERAEAVAREIGAGAVGFACDVADRADVEVLATDAEDAIGPVGLVFANAGVAASGPLVDADPRELDWVFGVNVRGAWSVASVFARRLIGAGRTGRICLTASEHALALQHAGAGLYTASKHAVLGLAEVFRAELPATVTVSVFCPGLVATELHRSALRNPKGPPTDVSRGAALMSRGMPAAQAARAAVDGVVRGDFFIVTHPSSLAAAETRHVEIMAAFGEQAPWTPEAERYDVNKVMAGLAAEGVAG